MLSSISTKLKSYIRPWSQFPTSPFAAHIECGYTESYHANAKGNDRRYCRPAPPAVYISPHIAFTATATKIAGRHIVQGSASRGPTVDEDQIDGSQDDLEGQEGDEKYVPGTPRPTICACNINATP